MRSVIAFNRHHLDLIKAAQPCGFKFDLLSDAQLEGGNIWTIIGDDSILALAGLNENAPGHLTGWALMADDLSRGEWGFVTRAVRDTLWGANAHRIDMLVKTDFAAGHRWAVRLGFVREGTLRAYGRHAVDMDIYAIVRKEYGPCQQL